MGVQTHMARSKQLEFNTKEFKKPGDTFGGSLLKGNPKSKRPLDSRFSTLVTLRAVQGGMRSLKTMAPVDRMVYQIARKHGVRIYQYSNVGNHLHILVILSRVSRWAGFIRELTGQIAQLMKTYLNLKAAFWLYRPHTRIVRGWKKAYRIAKDYVYLNELEAEGHIRRAETRTLKDLRRIFSDG